MIVAAFGRWRLQHRFGEEEEEEEEAHQLQMVKSSEVRMVFKKPVSLQRHANTRSSPRAETFGTLYIFFSSCTVDRTIVEAKLMS